MNLSTWNIPIYQLATLATLFTGTTVLLLLWLSKRENNVGKYWLNLALAVSLLAVAGSSSFCWLALGPLVYGYMRARVLPEQRLRRTDLYHLWPLSLAFFAPRWLVVLSFLLFLVMSYRLIKQADKRLMRLSTDRPRFAYPELERMLLMMSVLDIALLFTDAAEMAMSGLLIVMAAKLILKSSVVEPAPDVDPSTGLREKGRILKKSILEERLYEDPGLSLTSLAIKLNIHPHELSRIINVGLRKNFSDFVNEMRVRAVIRKMKDPAYERLTLLGIAFESGFNSKTTFIRVFKEITGKKPGTYKEELNKEVPFNNLVPGYEFSALPLQWDKSRKRNFMVRNYFKIAWRNLWRHKRMAAINIAGLGIGIAATVLIVLWVQNELSFDRSEPDAADIYRIKASVSITKTETWQWETSQYILGEHALSEVPEINGLARLQVNSSELNMHLGKELITEKQSAFVDEHWFGMFHYDLVSGSLDEFNKNPFSLVLTQSAANRYFNSQDAVGKILRIDTNNYVVCAVVKNYPANSSFRFDMFLPVASRLANPIEKQNELDWGNYNYLTFLRLRPGASPPSVAAKLLAIMSANRKDDKGGTKFSLVPLTSMHFENDVMNSSLVHGNRTIVNVFIVLSALLLTTACINYVNLTTARSSLRSKEVSIRKIVGADKTQLFGQFMSESLLVSLISLLVAIGLVLGAMPWFRTFTNKPFSAPMANPVAWLILSGTLLVSFLLNGLYPAFLLSSFQPLNVFRGRSVLAFKDVSLRRVLVVSQFVISVMLITGTLVIYRQMNYIKNTDPGYNRAEVFSFAFPFWNIPGVDFRKSDQLLQSVKQQLQLQASTANVAMGGTNLVDFKSSSSGNFDWPGRPKDFKPSFAPLAVDPDFARLMQLKLSAGRWFNNSPSDSHNVVLNETAVKLISLHGDPIGQRFIHKRDTGVIIGIVKDFHFKSLHDKIGPMILTENNANGFYIKTSKGNTASAIAAATKVWKQYFPDAPFEYVFLDDAYNNLYQAEQQQSLLMTAFAGIAIFISALGLLGLAAFAAEQKVKEIGIRKVLGARIQDIVSLLSSDFIKMVTIACILACPVAWWGMNKWLQSFAYRISLSWWLFALAAGIALLIALITVGFQSVRAALANPVKSLRND